MSDGCSGGGSLELRWMTYVGYHTTPSAVSDSFFRLHLASSGSLCHLLNACLFPGLQLRGPCVSPGDLWPPSSTRSLERSFSPTGLKSPPVLHWCSCASRIKPSSWFGVQGSSCPDCSSLTARTTLPGPRPPKPPPQFFPPGPSTFAHAHLYTSDAPALSSEL